MSVPPPSWMPNSTSTGSLSSSVRSTTDVSNAITRVCSVGSEASDAPSTPAWTTEARHAAALVEREDQLGRERAPRRAWPTSRSGMTVRCSGW